MRHHSGPFSFLVLLWLSIVYGALVGFSLGLTGGGGALFAVPLLVYGLGLPVREAASVSLAAVGTVSLVGAVQRGRAGQVEGRIGLIFAGGAMLGAPLGVRLAHLLPESLLLALFGGLMLVVAARLWLDATAASGPKGQDTSEYATVRPPSVSLARLVPMGLICGVLSGLFGVGGGFIIVPSLVIFAHVSMPRAVGTSLLVIALTSVSGVAAHLWVGNSVPAQVTALFIVGGAAGLQGGQRLGTRLSGPTLQKLFVGVLLGVALLVLLRPPGP